MGKSDDHQDAYRYMCAPIKQKQPKIELCGEILDAIRSLVGHDKAEEIMKSCYNDCKEYGHPLRDILFGEYQNIIKNG